MRHPLHSICPYFAMFPEDFVAKQLLAYTERGDTVFDPFCGRGTTVFESLLNGRHASGVDINPVAACIAGAKADSPTLRSVQLRLTELKAAMSAAEEMAWPEGEFFRACFHETTLQQLLFLRQQLDWKKSRIDKFIAAVILGALHGESHKTPNCLSNRMPRTISTKPDYSVRWWLAKGLVPPERDTFEVVENLVKYRLSSERPKLRGGVKLKDARQAEMAFPSLKNQVKLIVTSPPYLDTTDYSEDQWLRLWFLGGAERPLIKKGTDDRHTNTGLYWKFLAEAWAGCSKLVQKGTVIVIRIGGAKFTKDDLFEGVGSSLREGFADHHVRALHKGETTEIKNRQTNAFRPGTTPERYEHDFAFSLS
jgi:methylase of polypeptide subunit release factors